MSISTRKKSTSFYINNGSFYLYEPDINVKVEHDNVASEDSGRDENGVMQIEWKRRDIRKVSLTYSALTGAELEDMVNHLQGKEFSFHYKDLGKSQTMSKAYCGKCSYTFLTSNYYGTGESLYTDISINIIEE